MPAAPPQFAAYWPNCAPLVVHIELRLFITLHFLTLDIPQRRLPRLSIQQCRGALMKKRCALYGALLCFAVAAVAFAQDAAKVDSAHYKVEYENAQVRILRFHYGAHEKSVMHSHPDSVVVFLSDGSVKFTFPDGKTQDASGKAGIASFTPAQVHLPENVGDKPIEGILVELKTNAKK
jgi:quercetin dioxygenase-like cupin family protein